MERPHPKRDLMLALFAVVVAIWIELLDLVDGFIDGHVIDLVYGNEAFCLWCVLVEGKIFADEKRLVADRFDFRIAQPDFIFFYEHSTHRDGGVFGGKWLRGVGDAGDGDVRG